MLIYFSAEARHAQPRARGTSHSRRSVLARGAVRVPAREAMALLRRGC